MESNQDKVNQPKTNITPELSKETVKLDIFQHMKAGLSNMDKNCICENTLDNLYYCIPCKVSCCDKCSLPDHKTHLLLQKEKYSLKQPQIDNSFNSIENLLSGNDLFKNMQQKKQELITEIENTSQKVISLVNEWKDKKILEINDLFDEISFNIQSLNKKKEDCKKKLNDFANRHQKFFGLRDKNKDQPNIIFLINYDLISIPYLWSEEISKVGKNIEKNMSEYKEREENKDKEILRKVREALFMCDDEDPLTHEKLDLKLLPLIRLKVEIKDFNGDKLSEIDKRMGKFNKGVDSFKKAVMNSINKHGNYKDIEKENNIFEHRKVKGADNLFSQRKADPSHDQDNALLTPGHQIKNKNDIVLDNQVINKYFAHVLTDIYDQYFRIPTIELQSSHADLKLKVTEEDESNIAKVIENTNEIKLFDKKACKLTKRKVNLKKNPHGYTKFPLGCRSVLVGDKLYITGGKDEYKEYPNALVYDRKTEKIKRIMDMQNPRCYHTMVFNEVFETMMVIGGENNDSVEIFDPLSNRWQLLPELNIPRAIPLFYFDEGRGNMYVLFGVEGNYVDSNYIDCIEVLDLTEIKQGWMRINYNNKARMDFKCHLNIYPLNDYLLLIYGAIESRLIKRNACVYHLIRHEMNLIDKNLMDDLRNEAKNSKLLTSIVASVSRSSMSELSEASKNI